MLGLYRCKPEEVGHAHVHANISEHILCEPIGHVSP